MVNSLGSSAFLLNLQEIAAWQISHFPARQGPILADLPALQRGAVWKVTQIEELWDSILRSFPIGSFIVSPPNKELLSQNYKFQSQNSSRPQGNYLLLDGQQRATAVALAFDNVWLRSDDAAKGALWVDLGDAPESRQVEFVFRVLTRAHPWGYRRTNPDEILSSSAIRAALCAYQTVHDCPDRRPEDFTLWQTWPWDAEVPLPVAPFIAAVFNHLGDTKAVLDEYWQYVQKLPLMAATTKFPVDDAYKVTEARNTLQKQRQAVHDAFNNSASPWYQRLQDLVYIFKKVLLGDQNYRVPALLLDIGRVGDVGAVSAQTAKDAIELLFVRVNSAGTPLAGEELIYSLIKAEWPDVAQWMQKLPNRPALASRVAALCVRVVLARHNRLTPDIKTSLPPMPSITEFRRLMRDDNANDFKNRLKKFIDNDANSLFSETWNFLVMSDGDFRLLPSQAVDLAQNSPDVFLLLLRWIDRLTEAKIKLSGINEKTHRRTLGFLTSIAWFSPDQGKACRSIWNDLDSDLNNEQKLIDRFNITRFKEACHISERFDLQMIPLPTPDQLEKACGRYIYNNGTTSQTRTEATIHFPKGVFWNDKEWWYSQLNMTVVKLVNQDWQKRLAVNTSDDADVPDYSVLVEQATRHFLERLWGAKTTILLYAQRQALKNWYPKFDPSQPEMMEDKNRPWDIDHILAQNYFSGRWGIPNSVKEWGNSIGNLRAWPLEANRADGDTSPMKKLNTVSAEEKRYGINNETEKKRDSFVDKQQFDDYWIKAVPVNDALGASVSQPRFLANDYAVQYHENRVAAITAIVLRFIALYKNWYEKLRISDLQ